MNLAQLEFPLELKGDNASKRSTLLVIDDNEEMRKYLREALDEIYTIEEAVDSQLGLRLAKEIVPDLIITGLTSQDLDNESLCFQLKQCEGTSHIPIVVLSRINDQYSRITSFYLGADDFMTLPLQQVELQVRVENLIQLRKSLRRKFSKQMDLKPPSFAIQSKDQLFLQRVTSVMESNMDNTLFGAEQFAQQMGLSPRHLSRKLMCLIGLTSNEFIRKTRLQRAADMLNRNEGKVSEVAHQVGFSNLSYFSKCFKKFHQNLPSDYIRRADSSQRLAPTINN